MKDVELYGRVRYAVRIEGLSERAAARRFGIDPRKQDDEVLGAAGLRTQEAAGEAETRSIYFGDRQHSLGRQVATEEGAGEAMFVPKPLEDPLRRMLAPVII